MLNIKDNHPILQNLVHLAPTMVDLFIEDVTIGISNTKHMLISIPGKTFTLGISPGYLLQKGDGMYEAVKMNKPINSFIPESVFGVPLVANTIPVRDEFGTLIGSIGVASSVKNYEKINEISKSLFDLVRVFSESLKDLTDSYQLLADNIDAVSAQSNNIIESNKDIDKIVRLVKEVSEQTNILGLNASIEAARAGEAGKGFGIVASEIRNLAGSSKAHSESIKTTIDKIDELLFNLNDNIQKISEESTEQNVITTNLINSINKISDTAKELSEYAQKITKNKK